MRGSVESGKVVLVSLVLLFSIGCNGSSKKGSSSNIQGVADSREDSSPTTLAGLVASVYEKIKDRKIPPDFGNLLPTAPNRTESPKCITILNGAVERLPVKEVSADVKIEGPFARVTLHQVYENGWRTNIEAVYVFPLSSRAAIRSMHMKVGDRTLEAKIYEASKASAAYDSAVATGHTAALMSEQKPNVFVMKVGNLVPGAKVEIDVEYVEALVPEDGEYTFVLPTVVGPTYTGDSTAPWPSSPRLRPGGKAPYAFGATVSISSPLPIEKISSPSHKIMVTQKDANQAIVTLQKGHEANRDFILRYRLKAGKILTGAMVEDHGNGGHLMVMVEPPTKVSPQSIPPRDYIFILDTSGSMHGFPLNVAKKVIVELLLDLRPTDTFNLVFFASNTKMMSPKGSVPATPENVARAVRLVEEQEGTGGTELMDALKRAYSLPSKKGMSRTMVLVTDGFVRVEGKAFGLIARNVDKARMFVLGVSPSVNRYLLDKLSRAGQGASFVITLPDEAQEVSKRFEDAIRTPVLTDISLRFTGIKVHDPVPEKIPDLFLRRPILLFARYDGKPQGKVVVTGRTGAGPVTLEMDLAKALRMQDDTISTLWAREWIRRLEDLSDLDPSNARLREAIVRVALEHHLISRYTSFVVVAPEKHKGAGKPVRVTQPLPLPSGTTVTPEPTRRDGWRRRSLPLKSAPSTQGKPQKSESKPEPRRYVPPYTIAVEVAGGDGKNKELTDRLKAKTEELAPVLDILGVDSLSVTIRWDGSAASLETKGSRVSPRVAKVLQRLVKECEALLRKLGLGGSTTVTITLTRTKARKLSD